jgi:hypothetical protein
MTPGHEVRDHQHISWYKSGDIVHGMVRKQIQIKFYFFLEAGIAEYFERFTNKTELRG